MHDLLDGLPHLYWVTEVTAHHETLTERVSSPRVKLPITNPTGFEQKRLEPKGYGTTCFTKANKTICVTLLVQNTVVMERPYVSISLLMDEKHIQRKENMNSSFDHVILHEMISSAQLYRSWWPMNYQCQIALSVLNHMCLLSSGMNTKFPHALLSKESWFCVFGATSTVQAFVPRILFLSPLLVSHRTELWSIISNGLSGMRFLDLGKHCNLLKPCWQKRSLQSVNASAFWTPRSGSPQYVN